MLKLGWFSTGRGEGSRNLLQYIHDEIAAGRLSASIDFVFCNRDQGEAEGSDQFHALVHSYNIPLITLSSERFRRQKGAKRFGEVREEFDAEVLKRLDGYNPDIVVLAGYMLFTAAELCHRFVLLNTHPAAPGGPTGTWQQVIWELIERRTEGSGVQIQLATMDWDKGPVISYCTFPLSGPQFDPLWKEVAGQSLDELKSKYWEQLPLFQAIRQEGLKRETPLLLETLRAIAEGDVRIVGHQVVDRWGNPIAGHCLNDPIEERLKRQQ